MKNKQLLGHLAAMFTIFMGIYLYLYQNIINGFFSNRDFIFPFFIGYLALMIIYPFTMKVQSKSMKGCLRWQVYAVWSYITFRKCRTYLYVRFECRCHQLRCPILLFLLAYFLLKDEPLHSRFFIGFFIAMTGIVLISMNGMTTFQLNPLGDALALTATIVWAFYSILSKMINQYGYHIIQVTRRVFFYGLLWMIPLIWHFKVRLDWERLTNPSFAFHLLF